jgi:O-antigen/teichoic acid export membrane protein
MLALRQRRSDARGAALAQTRLDENVVWNIVGGGVSIGAGVLLLPLSIAVAGASDYGLWLLCYSTAQLVAILDLGLGVTLTREAATRAAGGAEDRFRAASVITVRVTRVLLLLVPPVVGLGLYAYLDSGPGSSESATSLAFMAGAAMIMLAGSIAARPYISILHGFNSYTPERKFTTVAVVGRALILLLGLWVDGGVILVVIAEVLSVLGPAVASLLLAHHRHGPLRWGNWSSTRPFLRTHVKNSVATFISNSSVLLAIQFPIFVVGSLLGLREVTAYSAVMRVYQTARQAIAWVVSPMMTEATREYVRGGNGGWGVHARAMNRCVWTIVPGFVFLALAARPVLELWLGAEFGRYAPALAAAALGAIIPALVMPGALMASAHGRPTLLMSPNLWMGSLTLLLMWPLTLWLGVAGSVVSVILPTAVMAPVLIRRPSSLTGLNPSRALRGSMAPLAATALGAGAALILRSVVDPSPRGEWASLVAYALIVLIALPFVGRLGARLGAS